MANPLQKLTDFRIAPGSDLAGPALRVAFWTLGCRLNQYDTEGIKTAMSAR